MKNAVIACFWAGELGVLDLEYLGFVIGENASEMAWMQSVIEQKFQQGGLGATRCVFVSIAGFVVG